MARLSEETQRLNEERAARGLGILQRYDETDCGESDEAVAWVDLVADILHAIGQRGFDPEGTLAEALEHYHAEIKGE